MTPLIRGMQKSQILWQKIEWWLPGAGRTGNEELLFKGNSFHLGRWKSSEDGSWWWFHDSVDILNTTKLYPLKGLTWQPLCYRDVTTIKTEFCCCCCSLEMVSFLMSPLFSFCVGPHELCSQIWAVFLDLNGYRCRRIRRYRFWVTLWGEAQESAFLTSSQVLPMLWFMDHTL